MNSSGHPQTLVAAHPDNRSALKTGVFSPSTLASRARELEAALAAQPHAQVLIDVLLHELAGLLVLEEAMDKSLEEDGLRGRGGKPRTLVTLRLRLNDKMLRTVELLRGVSPHEPEGTRDSHADPQEWHRGAEEPDQEEAIRAELLSLTTTIAFVQREEAITNVVPQDVDAEYFVRAVVVTRDPKVTTAEKARAARMLTRMRKRYRRESCQCFAGWQARDEIEFRSWIDGTRAAIEVEPIGDDRTLAALVRQVVRGERLKPSDRRTEAAVTDVLDAAVDNAEASGRERQTMERDLVDRSEAEPFWAIALSPDPDVSASERLTALEGLDALGGLRQCTCERPPERLLPKEKLDWDRAETIRLVAGRHFRAVPHVLLYPQTYLAIRDAIDSKLLELGDTGVMQPPGLEGAAERVSRT